MPSDACTDDGRAQARPRVERGVARGVPRGSALARGEDVADALVARTLFRDGRDAHARAQSGGSGVDVAASVYGGVLRYDVEGWRRRRCAPVRAAAAGSCSRAFWSGTSARTSDLRARVASARVPRPRGIARAGAMAETAARGCGRRRCARPARFVVARRENSAALLEALGRAADAPIVLPALRRARGPTPNARAPRSYLRERAAVTWRFGSAPLLRLVRSSLAPRALALVPLDLVRRRGGVRPASAHS